MNGNGSCCLRWAGGAVFGSSGVHVPPKWMWDLSLLSVCLCVGGFWQACPLGNDALHPFHVNHPARIHWGLVRLGSSPCSHVCTCSPACALRLNFLCLCGKVWARFSWPPRIALKPFFVASGGSVDTNDQVLFCSLMFCDKKLCFVT